MAGQSYLRQISRRTTLGLPELRPHFAPFAGSAPSPSLPASPQPRDHEPPAHAPSHPPKAAPRKSEAPPPEPAAPVLEFHPHGEPHAPDLQPPEEIAPPRTSAPPATGWSSAIPQPPAPVKSDPADSPGEATLQPATRPLRSPPPNVEKPWRKQPALHIGTIELHVSAPAHPQPPQPAPPPVRPTRSTSPSAPSLSRGFVSWYGLTQG
jgi:hypothetical protein